MDEMKKYMEIPRIGHKSTESYLTTISSKGYNIRVGIKFDGANSQIEVNDEGELLLYSRRTPLDEVIHLDGFYHYAHSKIDPTRLPVGYKIFGEWLVSHTIKYPQEMYRHFYLFNVYDSIKEEYISPHSDVYKQIQSYLVDEIGMKEEYIIYEGPYKGFEHLELLLKQVTRDGEEYIHQNPETFEEVFHEGLVIKTFDYRDHNNEQMFIKLVGERFQEVKKVKLRAKRGPDNSIEKQIAEFAVTEARVRKMLNKLVDENILQSDFDLEDMNTIAKNLPKRIYEDVMKEELDTILDEFEEFDEKLIGKKISSTAMSLAKAIIIEKIELRAKNL